jgi:hypothetical protein
MLSPRRFIDTTVANTHSFVMFAQGPRTTPAGTRMVIVNRALPQFDEVTNGGCSALSLRFCRQAATRSLSLAALCVVRSRH